MGIIRTLTRLLGWLCIIVSVLLALFALFGFLQSEDTFGRVVAGICGGVALLLLFLGMRALWHRGRRDALAAAPPPPSRSATESAERTHTGLLYDDFKWADPAPSRKQFAYAVHLGVKTHHGMSQRMLSDAIDEAIEYERSGEPATKEQLQIIKEYHGVIPKALTRGDANRVITFLEDHYLPCPFCGIEICATDDECCACNKNLRKMKIPIKL